MDRDIFGNQEEDLLTEQIDVFSHSQSEGIRHNKTVADEIDLERKLSKKLTELYLQSAEAGEPADDNARTIGMFTESDVNPVVGWLVCEDGPERGKSYVITGGRNFIGRSYKSDIVVYADPAVTRENHCSVVFEPKTFGFYVVPSDKAITHVNGTVLHEAQPLTEDDVIEIGISKFRMIPYCKEGRSWS